MNGRRPCDWRTVFVLATPPQPGLTTPGYPHAKIDGSLESLNWPPSSESRLARDDTMLVTGPDVNEQHSPLYAQLQASLNLIPAYDGYTVKSGTQTSVNELRAA